MNMTADLVLEQALQLPFQEKLKVLAKLAEAVNAESTVTETTTKRPERILGLREGEMWMADDFDAPLPLHHRDPFTACLLLRQSRNKQYY